MDDLWKLEYFDYSEENMINLFDIIGNKIFLLKIFNFYTSSFSNLVILKVQQK